jgi:tryptophan synthase beta chain
MERFSDRKREYLPTHFYNIKADLVEQPKPPLNPGTGEALDPSALAAIFPRGFIEQETSRERLVTIPAPVLEAYAQYRPTPLVYAAGLRKRLETPAHIFYKYEGVSPMGSHKGNTALMQAYLASREGVRELVTETGAGQWGSALAYAGERFGVGVRVFMVRSSFRQKPGRRIMMNLSGARVEESPGPSTAAGAAFFRVNPDHPGSLGIAIAEAVETVLKNPGSKYALGSVLDGVLLHQSVIGLEAEKQLAGLGLEPDVVIGCVGGGSNFAGISFPFIGKGLRGGKRAEFIAVEPEVCPSLTAGELRYDHGDSAGLTPLLYMHTLGKDFIPPPIHAGGLRYHGMAPLVSHLVSKGLVRARACSQADVFAAAKTFFASEGILPAPESAHAIAAVIAEARKAREENRERIILFNLSGHGFLDISAYETNGKGPAGKAPAAR